MSKAKDDEVAAGPASLPRFVCRECGTLIYPRRSPAGPMAMICECSRLQIETALAGLAVLWTEYTH